MSFCASGVAASLVQACMIWMLSISGRAKAAARLTACMLASLSDTNTMIASPCITDTQSKSGVLPAAWYAVRSRFHHGHHEVPHNVAWDIRTAW